MLHLGQIFIYWEKSLIFKCIRCTYYKKFIKILRYENEKILVSWSREVSSKNWRESRETEVGEKIAVTSLYIIRKYRIYQHILCPFMQREGPSIKYVSTFREIFDTPLPHISNSQHFNNPSLKSTSAFAKFSPPPLLLLLH